MNVKWKWEWNYENKNEIKNENIIINNNKIKLFLIEFYKKCSTGSILLKFKNNEKLIDTFIKQFSKENQAFGIWIILKLSINTIGDKNIAKTKQ